jgi:Asp-tRNA(Asn)/Glu-tRNA(Gln) amidotransferase A subunit family amidase
MSADTEILRSSATGLASRIASGDVSSTRAVDAFIAQIERVNGSLNAVVVKRYEEARDEARRADEKRARGEPLGPLHGVPVTVKECLDVVGTPSTFGIPSRKTHRPERDDAYVARLRAAGAIVVGKTNVSQLLMFTETDNPLYGRTNNPWNVARSPGGSSGGQGAIISAGAPRTVSAPTTVGASAFRPRSMGSAESNRLRVASTTPGVSLLRSGSAPS